MMPSARSVPAAMIAAIASQTSDAGDPAVERRTQDVVRGAAQRDRQADRGEGVHHRTAHRDQGTARGGS